MTHEEIESRLAVLEATVRELAMMMADSTASIAALMGLSSILSPEQVSAALKQCEELKRKMGAA